MQQYKQNRVNPPCQFVQLLLETEPIDHRVEQLKLVESNLERKQKKLISYISIHQEEEEVNELRNTIRLIKSTLNEGASWFEHMISVGYHMRLNKTIQFIRNCSNYY